MIRMYSCPNLALTPNQPLYSILMSMYLAIFLVALSMHLAFAFLLWCFKHRHATTALLPSAVQSSVSTSLSVLSSTRTFTWPAGIKPTLTRWFKVSFCLNVPNPFLQGFLPNLKPGPLILLFLRALKSFSLPLSAICFAFFCAVQTLIFVLVADATSFESICVCFRALMWRWAFTLQSAEIFSRTALAALYFSKASFCLFSAFLVISFAFVSFFLFSFSFFSAFMAFSFEVFSLAAFSFCFISAFFAFSFEVFSFLAFSFCFISAFLAFSFCCFSFLAFSFCFSSAFLACSFLCFASFSFFCFS